jgi:hypothetical protein
MADVFTSSLLKVDIEIDLLNPKNTNTISKRKVIPRSDFK